MFLGQGEIPSRGSVDPLGAKLEMLHVHVDIMYQLPGEPKLGSPGTDKHVFKDNLVDLVV